MTQTQNRIFDEMAKMFTNAAGMAHGVRQEVETVMRSQMERLLAGLDLVQREEFDVVRDMARMAREENEALKKRIDALEEALKAKKTDGPKKPKKPKKPKVAKLPPLGLKAAPEAPQGMTDNVLSEEMASSTAEPAPQSEEAGNVEAPKPDEPTSV